MKQLNSQGKKDISIIVRLTRSVIFMALLCITCIIWTLVISDNKNDSAQKQVSKENKDAPENSKNEVVSIPENFEIPAFKNTEEGKMAEYGYKLITETYALVVPGTPDAITGNRLACSNCHLNGGTKPFAAPYVGLSGVFPIFIGRENKVESLEERVNGCFERSMDGRAIDVNSKEMRSIIAYIKHVSKGSPVGIRVKGQGFVEFKAPERATDLKKGRIVYEQRCVSCHGQDGGGMKGLKGNKEGGYIYPPLWGKDSYNDGAGMARLLTAARFIKGNMPLGVTHESPILSDEEAYDVAAYINSHARPVKANKEQDYPDLEKKPKDCPYPPYADNIPQEQHKFGPFNFGK